MRKGNAILLVVSLWLLLLLPGNFALGSQSPPPAFEATENRSFQNSTPSVGPMPPRWAEIKPGITKEEFHAILGPAQSTQRRKNQLGNFEGWTKRDGDFIYYVSATFDQNDRFKTGYFSSTRALISGSYTPSDAPLKIPAAVSEEARRQSLHYLQGIDHKGIPLLDPSIDWADLRNWPDELELAGERPKIRVTDRDYDSIRIVPSKADLIQGRVVGVSYQVYNGQNRASHGPYSSWTRGTLQITQGFRWKDKEVFQYSFYENGQLQAFSRDDYTSGAYYRDDFDPDGQLKGRLRGRTYFWEMEQVSKEEYHKYMFKMWGIKREP